MRVPIFIDKCFAQRHEAPAFAINQRAAIPGGNEPAAESPRGRKCGAMQFRIAARKKDRIGDRAWRLIC